MKCCPHIESLYTRKKSTTTINHQSNQSSSSSPDFDHLERLFKTVIDLNRNGKSQTSSSSPTTTTNDSLTLKCWSINFQQQQQQPSHECTSQLYLCAHCMLIVSCFAHLDVHARQRSHSVWIEITHAAVYCCACKDVQYNPVVEDFARDLFVREGFLPFGKFSEWQPSQTSLELIKKNFVQHNQQYQQQQQQNQEQSQHHNQQQTLASLISSSMSNTNSSNHNSNNNNNHIGTSTAFKLKRSSIIGLRGLINLGNTCFMNCILQTLTHIPSLRDYFLGDQHQCCHPNSRQQQHLGSVNGGNESCHSNNNNNNNNNETATLSTLYYHNNSNNNGSVAGGKSVCLVCELVILFQEFYSGKRSPYIPFNLLHQVWTQVKHLAGYEQQDAHEFFIAALNTIHKNCIDNDEICINLNKNRKKNLNYNNCNCIIDKIFTGGLQSDVICSNCNHVSTTVDPFWDISLDLYKNSNKSMKSIKSEDFLKLEDCLLKFTLPEILTSFNCSKCKCSREARKQFTMKKLPIVCCFHLKRFEQSNRIHKKIFDHISFPEILDMSPFMSSSQVNSNNNSNSASDSRSSNQQEDLGEVENERSKFWNGKFDSNKYFLFAVVNHHGTLESGHYTSFIRLKNDQWFKCDDHVISRATLSEVMSSEGYLLFYHKLWNDFE